ncbi:MAG TPA: NAD-dependent epimerase/dehydratase family protein, partial [Polyangiaceae bacterium]|nr:NAD-dependent epimerase/dehydratase family protein [Polyangiaceae bacterium]
MSNSLTSSHSLTLAEQGRLGAPPARRRVVAVTGAAQFLGSNLIGLLEEDPNVRKVVCLDSEAPTTAGAKSRVYNVSLTEASAEERMAEILSAEAVDVMVHLAFLDSPSHSTAFAHELESVGTMHVLNACRRPKVHKVV